MRVLHLISQHPDSTGSGIYLRNIIREAARAGHENFLIAGLSAAGLSQIEGIDPTRCQFIRFGTKELDFTIPGMSDIMPYPSTRFSDLTGDQLDRYEHCFAQAVTAMVDKAEPDIIHSHHLWIISALTRRLFPDIPMVTSCHSTDLRQSVLCPHIKERVLEPCRCIDRILALSSDQRDNIINLYGINPAKISVVGGGFDDRIFSPKIKKTMPAVKILYAGKLSFSKGVDCLLRAFNSLSDKDVELHLAGSGSGDEERYCLELAAGLGERVHIYGHIDQRKLAALMADCHIFILPSFFEGLPLVLLEAVASGCRIITTDLTGCLELLDDADTDLVELVPLPPMAQIDRPAPGDIALIENRLILALQNMVTRVRIKPTPSLNNTRKVTHPFRWPAVCDRIFQAYDAVRAQG
ncbi:MAG: glycosyltransferase family 4 protein [Pelovirga sp.]